MKTKRGITSLIYNNLKNNTSLLFRPHYTISICKLRGSTVPPQPINKALGYKSSGSSTTTQGTPVLHNDFYENFPSSF